MNAPRNRIHRIRTARLELRVLELADAPGLQEMLARNREDMLPWVPWAVHEPESVDAKRWRIREWTGEFLLDKKYSYGIFEGDDPSLRGVLFLFTRQGEGTLEIGYIIDREVAGRGYATEASYAATRLGLDELNVDKMMICHDPRNAPSRRVPEKLGYTLEGTTTLPGPDESGERAQSMTWALLAGELERIDGFEPVRFEVDPGWE